MADGVTITSGAASTPPNGTVIATDDTGASGHAQLVKLAIATNGSATLIPADASVGLLVNTGLGESEGTTATGGDQGIPALAISRATPSITATEGEYTPLSTDAGGQLWVRDGAASDFLSDIYDNTVTMAAQAAAFKLVDSASTGSDRVGITGFIRDDALSALGPAEGDFIAGRVDANGAIWIQLAGALSSAIDSIAVGAVAGVGCDVIQNLDVDESEDAVKASAGTVYGYYFSNEHASSKRYLKFYNATTASVTVGSTTPVMTLSLPPASSGHIGFSPGVKFDTAITIAATTALAVADTGAPGANEVIVNVFFK